MKTYGYCDLHPACRLWDSGSLIANNSMENSGDANALFDWTCSREDCVRAWTPTLGYVTKELGRQIVYHGTGPRCPSHFEYFMVVGDSGAGRRYVCPVDECNQVGPVVDTPRQDCGTQKASSEPVEAKPEREMRIFRRFARAADLAIENARNCERPYPDITFTIAGEEKYIELAEITDETLAKRRASLLKGNTEGALRIHKPSHF